VYVSVDDIDAHYERAVAAGATILSDLEDNLGSGSGNTGPRISRAIAGCSRLVSSRHVWVSDTSRSRSHAWGGVTVRCGFAPQADLFAKPTAWCQTL
jgi:hypothetical protein